MSPPANAHAEQTAGWPFSQRRAVLVVEDDVLVRGAVCDYLRDHGLAVIEAEDANEALAILSADAIDLVFTDVDLPGGISGVELARWIEAELSGLPVLLTSGGTRAFIAPELRRSGRFFAKPYQFGALLDKIRSLLPADGAGR